MLVTKQLTVAIDFYSMEKYAMEVNGYRHLFCQHTLKYILFVSMKKKLIRVWNNLRVSKWWQDFHSWVNDL